MDFIIAKTTCFDFAVLGLTPLQRLDAVTKYHSGSASNQFSVIIIGILVCTLGVLLILWNRQRNKANQQSAHYQFGKEAQAKKLTDREYRLLLDIAMSLALKRIDSIFRLPTAFDRAAGQLIKNIAAEKGAEQSQRLEAELSLLREKLGFKPLAASKSHTPGQSLSSDEIPLKKKLYIRRLNRPGCDLEATVVHNTPAELTVEFDNPAEVVFGQPWACRYYLQGLVAEFFTMPIRCNGTIVTLKHSHHVRLINRRRFPRARMHHSAYIAKFPFKKDNLQDFAKSRKLIKVFRDSNTAETFAPPSFVPAIVTELGGPGIKISTDLDIRIGERILFILRLDPPRSHQPSYRTKNNWRMIETIAKVRSITRQDGKLSAVIELINLDDHQIDEMARLTNEMIVNKKTPQYKDIHSAARQTTGVSRAIV